jgi:hypothetical protein
VQEDLPRLCSGRSAIHVEPQDAIAVDILVASLPDRLVAALFGWCRDRLAPGGALVATGPGPSTDAAVVDHVLGWPLLRRPGKLLVDLLAATGFRDPGELEGGGGDRGGASVVVRGRRTGSRVAARGGSA